MNKINPEPEYEKTPAIKTQKDWISHFNAKGEKMISAPDIYQAIKEKQPVVESLKKDFQDSYVVTSTQTKHSKDNLNAVIIHDAGSEIIKPKSYEIEVPDYSGSFEHDAKAKKYLQALFDTKDNIKEIIAVLQSIDDKKREIRLWTPSQASRADYPVRAVRLCFYSFDGFDVVGDVRFDDDDGLSRGVRVVSQKPKASAKKQEDVLTINIKREVLKKINKIELKLT